MRTFSLEAGPKFPGCVCFCVVFASSQLLLPPPGPEHGGGWVRAAPRHPLWRQRKFRLSCRRRRLLGAPRRQPGDPTLRGALGDPGHRAPWGWLGWGGGRRAAGPPSRSGDSGDPARSPCRLLGQTRLPSGIGEGRD